MSTLASLRRLVASRLNILYDGTVSGLKADASTAAWYDSSLAGEFKDTFRNAWILIKTATNAANVGAVRQLAGNSDGLMILKRPLPAALVAADTYELYRRHQPDAIRKGLNWAIDSAFPYIFARFEQEVPENASVREYAYPSLSSPAAPTLSAPNGGGGAYYFKIATRSSCGDAVPSPASPASTQVNNRVNWTAVSNADAYLVLRSTNQVQWYLLSSVPAQPVGTAMSLVDDGSYDAGITAYTLATTSPGLVDLRQLMRRSNPGVLPAQYQEMRGGLWEDLGKSVAVHWLPTSTDYLFFVGYAKFAQLVNDTDAVDAARLPDEMLLCGAAKILYEDIAAGEASSSTQYFERQAKNWQTQYEQKRRDFAMEQIGREQHPPEVHVVRGQLADLGPVTF